MDRKMTYTVADEKCERGDETAHGPVPASLYFILAEQAPITFQTVTKYLCVKAVS